MRTWHQSYLPAIFFTITLFLAPRFGAGDDDEPADSVQDAGRIEQEFAEMVEHYNTFFRAGRFDEAIVLAKQAELLYPEMPTAEVMLLKARSAKQAAVRALSILKATFAAHLSGSSDGSNRIVEPRRIADRAIYRLAGGNDEDYAEIRCELDASLERKLEAVDQVCHLTGAQKCKLRIAGRGDIKRFLDRVESVRTHLESALAMDDDFPGLGANAIRRGLFEQGSLFSKTLKASLTKGQDAAFEDSTLRRWPAGE
ncbi:MAG: hypothetical protein HY290_29775 [Planctomycetia bacterium]|nr:hypothetical protein [Planctomycetia bacterium]